MKQERVTTDDQVQARLQHCLEQRDRPGILALTAWLVHRHGHPLLQQLLSQPQWSSHRLWWGAQIGQPHPGLEPQSESRRQPPHRLDTVPAGKDHQDDKAEDRTPIAAKGAANRTGPSPSPRQHPAPQAVQHRDGYPESWTDPWEQGGDGPKITPAQVTKRRLKMDKPAPPVEAGELPTVTRAASEERRPKEPLDQQRRSLHLRGWLPRRHLPHQRPQQDAA